MVPFITEFPSSDKRQYFIWCYPPATVERENWKVAHAWIATNARAYEKLGKFYSRDIFSEKTHSPRTAVDRFVMATDLAVVDAVTRNRKNPWVLVGKWLIRIDRDDADHVWKDLGEKVESGKVPYRAKISTARENAYLKDLPANKRLICLYTPNFLWRKDVREARLRLRAAGFRSKLYYRPDVFTILDIKTVAGTDFKRDIWKYLRKHGVSKLRTKHRYFG